MTSRTERLPSSRRLAPRTVSHPVSKPPPSRPKSEVAHHTSEPKEPYFQTDNCCFNIAQNTEVIISQDFFIYLLEHADGERISSYLNAHHCRLPFLITVNSDESSIDPRRYMAHGVRAIASQLQILKLLLISQQQRLSLQGEKSSGIPCGTEAVASSPAASSSSISRPKRRHIRTGRWSEEELRLLKKNLIQDVDLLAIQKQLGRPLVQILQHVSLLSQLPVVYA